ncbi:nucleotide exchange factor GrpE [Streptomyces sp. HNM0645]|uniref:nucleotide exchange factor GrpE n=1 Tax=Streptomyces sp. HNM0645 TaxID=2782343 RepID=UPI0024B801F4|nr:nucleotide exchange factor GrpE [Streptomyces sp. HNM0645]MDI9888782.1 nucleotide exchange factor GrpE [Streptomyces sp. HNM0645]
MTTDDVPVPPEEPTRAPAAEAQPDTGEPAEELEEIRDRWRRSLADLDNLRKRHARELQRERSDERARTSAAWLPVIDNLELALQHAGSDPSAVLEGVKAVRDLAVDVLRGLGYPRYEETGVPFDPARHEVVGVVDDPEAVPNTVVRVQRPGYGEGDRQLRPASVVVNKRRE